MKPLYIFDLDGTLALTDHRQHLLEDKADPNRWKRFFAACVDDTPNLPVLQVLKDLSFFADIWIWSGRSDEVRTQTLDWLVQHSCFIRHHVEEILRMRQAGDFTPDDELKMAWLQEMSGEDRRRLVAIFDDRDKVVAMWRSAGIPCFQVAPGSF